MYANRKLTNVQKDDSCLYESQRKPMINMQFLKLFKKKTAATDQNVYFAFQRSLTVLLNIKYGCLTKICQTASTVCDIIYILTFIQQRTSSHKTSPVFTFSS